MRHKVESRLIILAGEYVSTLKDTLQGLFSTALENLVSSGVLDDVKSIEISF